MTFVASKLFWIVFEPANLLLLILLFGLWRMSRTRRRGGMALAALAAWSFLVIAALPTAQWSIMPLEARFPVPALRAKVDGIILLGGAVNTDITFARGQPSLNDSAERIIATMALARRYPAARVVVSGGNGNVVPRGDSEAATMRAMLAAMGLEDGRILLEDRSRTTFDNAVFSKALVQPKPGEVWLLVTSAYHMPRAVGCFRHVGWEVVPYPVDYRTEGQTRFGVLDLSDNLMLLRVAMHEWVGLAAYRALGRTDTLFPAP